MRKMGTSGEPNNTDNPHRTPKISGIRPLGAAGWQRIGVMNVACYCGAVVSMNGSYSKWYNLRNRRFGKASVP